MRHKIEIIFGVILVMNWTHTKSMIHVYTNCVFIHPIIRWLHARRMTHPHICIVLLIVLALFQFIHFLNFSIGMDFSACAYFFYNTVERRIPFNAEEWKKKFGVTCDFDAYTYKHNHNHKNIRVQPACGFLICLYIIFAVHVSHWQHRSSWTWSRLFTWWFVKSEYKHAKWRLKLLVLRNKTLQINSYLLLTHIMNQFEFSQYFLLLIFSSKIYQQYHQTFYQYWVQSVDTAFIILWLFHFRVVTVRRSQLSNYEMNMWYF